MAVSRKIIAIGGGAMMSTFGGVIADTIEREAIRLVREEMDCSRKIRVLFIPTASGDSADYCLTAYLMFGVHLGCEYQDLCLTIDDTSKIAYAKIQWADIIYVGGGNTREMMRLWDQTGVSTMLREAHEQGKVLMGLSAGSICWFSGGLSDAERLDGIKDWKPIWIDGLGLIPMLHSPHFDTERWRRVELDRMLQRDEVTMSVVALPDYCALEVIDSAFRVISSIPNRCASLYRSQSRSRVYPLSEFRSLSLLR